MHVVDTLIKLSHNQTRALSLNVYDKRPKSLEGFNAAHLDCGRHWILEWIQLY